MAAAPPLFQTHDAMLGEEGIKLPKWVVVPEDPQFAEGIQQSMGTTILSPKDVILHFSIFKCLTVSSGGGGHGPSIGVLTSTGNHSGILMCSNFVSQEHTKAYLMFRPMVDSDDTWCSTFKRISNSIGVSQLAYGKFIEVFDKYFVTGTFTSTQLKELFDALNASINKGRDIFTNKLKDLLTRFRKKKEKDGENFKDRKTYEEFVFYITDVLRTDLLEDVGQSFPVGSLATLELTGSHDTYTTRNDGGTVTDTFKRAAYNSFIIITVTTKSGEIITIQMDFNRSSFSGSIKKISFWNGQLIEYTTTDDFIKQVIDKLAAVKHAADVGAVAAGAVAAGAGAGTGTGPGGHVDADAARTAHAALLQIIEGRKKGKKFGSNTAITTGCQVPLLFYHTVSEKTQRVDVVFPPRLRDSYESVVGTDGKPSSETGYTGYYILCPKFVVPFSTERCDKVLFFCNYPSSSGWFKFPHYDYRRSAEVIGDNDGTVQSSMDTLRDSPPQVLSSPSSSPVSLSASLSHPPPTSAASLSLPPPTSTTAALTTGTPPPPSLSDESTETTLEHHTSVDVPNPTSFFRSIFNKCFSYFFSATVGNITQTQPNFFDDDLNVDKLLIGNALDLANDVDTAEDGLLVHAARHALDAVFDLIGAFELDETNTELQVMIKLAGAAAEAAPAAAAAAAAAADLDVVIVRNCVHVAAFAVRGVACICACENASNKSGSDTLRQVSSAFSELLQQDINSHTMMNSAAQLALAYNDTVIKEIKEIERMLLKRTLPTMKEQQRTFAKKLKGGRLRSRHYLHRVSRKRQRTLKKKNISRKYSKYSSGCDGIRSRSRSLRRSCRRSYSRKISNNN